MILSRVVMVQVLDSRGQTIAEAAVGESLIKGHVPVILKVAGEQTEDGPAATPWEIMPGDELILQIR